MQWLELTNQWVWGPILLGLIIGTGLFLTIYLKGLQFFRLGRAFRLVIKSRSSTGKGDISPFQSLTTALSASLGTGNIAGVATAITIGGLGAIFWMWVSGLIGMALTYSEALLSVRYRVQNKRGEMAGGPMYYLERGCGWRWMGLIYAVLGVVASFGIGNLVQANSIADVMEAGLGVPRLATGIVLVVVIGVMVIGGIKSIGRVTEILVPAMAFFYIVGGLVIIAIHITDLPGAVWRIVDAAFSGQAMVGGFLGASAMMALRMGVARGTFSNEAGMGSAGIAAAAARTKEPAQQALINMTGTFIDTLVVCTITGLVLAVTGVLGARNEAGIVLNGAPLTAYAFQMSFPGGGVMVAIGLILFAYSTILGWAYYGEKCLEYIAGTMWTRPYRVIFSLVVIFGTLLPLNVVWNFADIANGLMAVPNLIALITLTGVIGAETKRYFQRVQC